MNIKNDKVALCRYLFVWSVLFLTGIFKYSPASLLILSIIGEVSFQLFGDVILKIANKPVSYNELMIRNHIENIIISTTLLLIVLFKSRKLFIKENVIFFALYNILLFTVYNIDILNLHLNHLYNFDIKRIYSDNGYLKYSLSTLVDLETVIPAVIILIMVSYIKTNLKI